MLDYWKSTNAFLFQNGITYFAVSLFFIIVSIVALRYIKINLNLQKESLNVQKDTLKAIKINDSILIEHIKNYNKIEKN